MNKIIILTSVLFTSFTIAQSTDKLNNTEIEQLKKKYFYNLQVNQDARVFSINEERKTYVYKKFTNHKIASKKSFTKDSIKRDIIRKSILYDLKIKKINHSLSLTNTIGYRRVNNIFDQLERVEKKNRLKKENSQVVIIRKDHKNKKIKVKKEQLKSKIKSLHELLKKKYAVPTKDKP